jgi:hypothetical protein
LNRIERESRLEERCVQRVEQLGGLALKLQIPGVRGFPDRTIMLPGAVIFFAEFKRLKTGRVSTQQNRWAERLRARGFPVYFVDHESQFEYILQGHLNAEEV